MTKSRLGKGLSALIPMDTDFLSKEDSSLEIEISKIKPNRYQPRRKFDEEKLEELANSIKEHGVVQPIMVRPCSDGSYELVAGERRLRACQKIKLNKIPAVVKDISEQQMIEIALIENIQRHDLNPVEEAQAYRRLMTEFKLTQEQVAEKVGKSRSLIANMLRLLNLPPEIQDLLSGGTLTIGHVRPLLALADKTIQITLAQQMLEDKMTARDAENRVQELLNNKTNQSVQKKKEKADIKLPPVIADIEEKLRSLCGTKVRIFYNEGKGRIEIDYYNNDDLDRIFNLFYQDEANDS